ncbi:protein SDA1 homolog isoform X2 [Liolophura sinensis]|uniref:protein SDA1 homolog isoform X2 n=1 Tax=Liolophura sinensis TaxID=3198878 RepID=UPI00315809B0
MADRSRNKLPSNLPQLQNLIKRDPDSYRDEFLQQLRHFQSNLEVFQLKPSKYVKTLDELVIFLAQVSHCYPEELAQFPQQLRDLLHKHATILDTDMRMTFCRGLILLRNKGLIAATTVLELFFGLFRCQDKLLRKTLYSYIVNDIKNVNAKHKNAKLNTALQNFMYTMLRDNNAVAAKMSLDVMVELYRRNVWNDSKTVNVITTACFSKITKILVAALKFFLGSDEMDPESDSESEGEQKTEKQLFLAHRVGKKSRKRKNKLNRALQSLKKHKKKKKPVTFNFSALHLIHDPQDFSEKLFRQLESSNERFEVKVMMINLISRLIGIHQLFLLNFYPFLQRFLQPHQRDVTRLLLYTAQASHELVPPEIIESVLMTIANNFITERNSGEVMAVGLNAVREICARCPLSMTEDLLRDLAQYKSHKDKAVMMAARALIHLYRTANSSLLHKRDRGKPTEAMAENEALGYGAVGAKDYLPGADTLPEEAPTQEHLDNDVIFAPADGWESCSEDEDDSDGEWIDVPHSSDEDEAQAAEEEKLDPEERRKRAQEISAGRILTQEEFKQITLKQALKDVEPGAKGKKRKHIEISDGPESGDVLRLEAIENVHKKRLHDKESRLATVLAGREDREKFGSRKSKKNPEASKTNKQKKKGKAFMMMKHKVRKNKTKRSFKDKQIALRNSLLKRQKRK